MSESQRTEPITDEQLLAWEKAWDEMARNARGDIVDVNVRILRELAANVRYWKAAVADERQRCAALLDRLADEEMDEAAERGLRAGAAAIRGKED